MKILRLFDSLKLVLATVACVFAIVPAHAATLPVGYTELEYLESTVASSQAYINTGLNFNSNYIYEINFLQSKVYNSIMGAAIEAYNKKGAFILTYCNDDVCFYSSTTSASLHSSLSLPNNVRHTAKYQQSTKTALLDDRNVWSASWITDENIPYNVFLFAYNRDGNAAGGRSGYLRIYSYSVKDADGVLIQNLVPARRDSDGVLGMYDLADSNPATAFHTNAGTGDFVAGPAAPIKIATTKYNEQQFAPVETRLDAAVAAVDTVVTQTMTQAQQIDQIANEKQTRPDEGCTAKYCLLVEDEDGTPHWYPIAGANGVEYVLPAGYTQLEYIESNGTQYINTGIYATQNTAIETKFINLSGASTTSVMIGNGWNSGGYQFSIVARSQAPNRIGGLSRSLSDFWTTNREFIVQMNKTGLYVDGELFGWSGSATEFTSTNPLTLLGDPTVSGRGATVKLFYMKIYENDTMVRNFIPAKNASDVVGMYDLVSGQFFTNAGTGTFTAGPDM